MGLGLVLFILFEKLGDGVRRERSRGFQLSPRDGLLQPGFLELAAPEGAKELFVFLNAYGPDRHGEFTHPLHVTNMKYTYINGPDRHSEFTPPLHVVHV